jgi:PAS domain S-box-containing protein
MYKAADKYSALLYKMEQGFCIIEVIFDGAGKAVDYRFLETNPVFEKQTGLQNAAGKTIKELQPAHEEHWFKIYGNVVKTGESVHFENEAAHLAGGVWYEVFAFPFDKPEKNQVAILFNDITERKKAERNQAFLSEISKDLVELDNIAITMERLGEKIAKHFRVPWCSFAEFTDDLATGIASYGWHAAHVRSLKGIYRMGELWTPEQKAKNNRGELSVTNDTQNDPRLIAQTYAALGIGSFISVPLATKDKFRFLLSILDTKPRLWQVHEIELMRELVVRIWTRLEKARAEEAMRKSEDKYRSLFNSIDEGFCVIEIIYNETGEAVNYRFKEVNKEYERQTGQQDPSGKLGPEVAPLTEPYWLNIYDNVVRTGEPVRFENYHEGSHRWYESYASRIGGPGSRQVAIVFRDITERKNADERQTFLLKLNDAIRMLDDPQEIQSVSADLLGAHLKVNQSLYGETIGDYVDITHSYAVGLPPMIGKFRHLDFGERLIQGYRSGEIQVCYNTRTDPTISEAERKALSLAYIGAYVAAPLIKSGEWVGTLAVHSIVPRNWKQNEIDLVKETAERTWAAMERARAEDALRKSEQQLKQLLQIRDDFIGIAGHELQTPVTTMKVFAEVAQEKLEEHGSKEEGELMRRLNKQIDRLTWLINDLLDISKISEGKLAIYFEPTDLNEVIQEQVEEIRRMATQQFRLQLNELPIIDTDKERIGQVITNLLSNAVKYSPDNSTVTITSEPVTNGIQVSVHDEGIGISPEDQPKIFDRFYRVTANNPGALPGMGLGLYISSEIVHRHGGTLTVESEPGKGSAFVVMLPVGEIS